MFSKTARVIFEKGLRFFEEDILFDDHTYSAPMCAEYVCEYVKNGIGFIIALTPNVPLSAQNFYYFVRIDHYSASLFLVNDMHYTRIEHVSTPFTAPIQHFKIRLDIKESELILSLNNRTYMHCELNHSTSVHHLGIYSQKNNIISHFNVKECAPKKWEVNTANIDSGRISFFEHGFEVSHCKHPAEVYQENIYLKQGTYYLNHILDGLESYVFHMDSPYEQLKAKNILRPDNSFILNKDSNITLYYGGRNGTVKNIFITPFKPQSYLATSSEITEKKASTLKVMLNALNGIEMHFKVNLECEGTLFSNDFLTIGYFFTENNYKLLLEKDKLTLYKEKNKVLERTLVGRDGIFLEGVDAFINYFVVRDKENKLHNWLDKSEKQDLLTPFINTPILAYDDDSNPLDLSSSFRIVNNHYIFTNTERESFKPEKILRLSKPIASIVQICGVPKNAVTYDDSFYVGTKENINDITAYTKHFIPILDYYVDERLSQIIIKDSLKLYKEIIIDYDKAHSYAINYLSELGRYKTTTTEERYHYYYSTEKSSKFITTPYMQKENVYIVLETKK